MDVDVPDHVAAARAALDVDRSIANADVPPAPTPAAPAAAATHTPMDLDSEDEADVDSEAAARYAGGGDSDEDEAEQEEGVDVDVDVAAQPAAAGAGAGAGAAAVAEEVDVDAEEDEAVDVLVTYDLPVDATDEDDAADRRYDDDAAAAAAAPRGGGGGGGGGCDSGDEEDKDAEANNDRAEDGASMDPAAELALLGAAGFTERVEELVRATLGEGSAAAVAAARTDTKGLSRYVAAATELFLREAAAAAMKQAARDGKKEVDHRHVANLSRREDYAFLRPVFSGDAQMTLI